jgi:hypothetical protein
MGIRAACHCPPAAFGATIVAMYSRLERRSRLSLYDDFDGDDLFCNCASCGCSACLSHEEVGDAGRAPRGSSEKPRASRRGASLPRERRRG